ncbi:MAG: class I SAM-dependent methyltransferase [Ferruginibacter sp.]
MSTNESSANDTVIKEHYKIQAEKHLDSALSTMEDPIIRQKEVEIITNFFNLPLIRENVKDVLEIGCGNGYTINLLKQKFPGYNFTGLDFSEDLLSIANKRNLENVNFCQGDVRKLEFADASFDVIYTERCIINLLTWEEQQQALNEMHRILKKDGYILFMESFTDGYENLNKARTELGLDLIAMPHHNLYFDKSTFEPFVSKKFKIMDPVEMGAVNDIVLNRNFLSTHYFVARVMHPLSTKGDPFLKNTEFVKFHSFLPPSGCYAAIQVYFLKKN